MGTIELIGTLRSARLVDETPELLAESVARALTRRGIAYRRHEPVGHLVADFWVDRTVIDIVGSAGRPRLAGAVANRCALFARNPRVDCIVVLDSVHHAHLPPLLHGVPIVTIGGTQ